MTQLAALGPRMMVEPSCWLKQGIELDASGAWPMFRFTEALQARSDELLRLNKAKELAPEQSAELESLSQLSQVFTYTNSLLAAQALWSLPRPENSSLSELSPIVNIVKSDRIDSE